MKTSGKGEGELRAEASAKLKHWYKSIAENTRVDLQQDNNTIIYLIETKLN